MQDIEPWKWKPRHDSQHRDMLLRSINGEISREQLLEWTRKKNLHEKVSKYYTHFPSHINETYTTQNVIYFAVGSDCSSFKRECSKNGLNIESPEDKFLIFDKYRQFEKSESVYVKIGTTRRGVKRIRDIQTGCPFPVGVWYWFRGGFEEEATLHEFFKEDNTAGEWFMMGPRIKDYIDTMTAHALTHKSPRNEEELERIIG